jgi:hypothetical protein
MEQQPDFFKRHTLFSSISLLFLLEVVDHVLWLRGFIPDNNVGGQILYGYVPLAWLVVTIILVARKFLKSIVPNAALLDERNSA